MSGVTVKSYEYPKDFSELVLHELDTRYSREVVTIAANSGEIPFGMVLARRSDGNYEPLKENAGTLGDAKAVLITASGVPAATETQQALVLRGYCVLNGSNALFDVSVTKKADALAALSDRGFIIKEIPDVDA